MAAFLAMRPGEERLVAWMAALFISTQAGHGLGANTGDALFFVRFGVEFLPYMILASGGVVMVSMVAYGAGLARVGGRRFLPPLAWGLALVLAAERLAVGLDLAAVYALIWLTEQLVIMLTFMMMWNAAGEACDARQAKRLFPLFASAGIAGGMVGNLITGPLAVAIGTQNILLVHAGLLIGVGVLSAGVAARFFAPPQPTVSSSALSDLKAGYQVTRQSELLRLTAVTAAAFSALFFLVVFPFSEQVAASFGSEAQIAGFLGLFSGAATGLTFLVSLFVANRLFARIGVVATALLVPLVYLAGFGLWAVSFTLLTATIVRGAQWVAVNALGGTASSSLFNVVSPSRRGQVMAFVSGVPAQLGVMASGALLIAGSALTTRQMALVGLLVAAASLVVVWRMRPAYGNALLEALRQGLVDVFTAPSPGLQKPAGDADAVRAIARALKDERPAVRRLAASLLGRLGGEAVVEPLLSAAGDDHPEVRATAFRALRTLGSSQAPSLARTALHDPVALVRREAVMTLADNPEGRSSLEGCLADPDPPVRAAAAAALRSDSARRVLTRMLRSGSAAEVEAALEAATDWQEVGTQAEVERLIAHPRPAIRLKAAGVMARHAPPGRSFTGRLLGLLEDPDHTVRVGMAETLRDHPALTGPLLGLLTQGSEQAQEGAVEALRGRTEAGPALLQ
ncbi:MAG: MFS transporter, partial [Actinomycetota bacterium]|nr:MFS transporter [Actinomycetota bacterium]